MALTGHAACIDEMFTSLAKGVRPQTDCRDNLGSIRMVYRAIDSSKQKMRVTF
jgi:hypothetical protein